MTPKVTAKGISNDLIKEPCDSANHVEPVVEPIEIVKLVEHVELVELVSMKVQD